MLNWIGLVLSLIPVVYKLMQAAEVLMSDQPKSGAEKKAFVIAAIEEMIKASGVMLGQEQLMEKVQMAISPVIDIAAGWMFRKEGA